jgi:CheY-like chemotaxis protein
MNQNKKIFIIDDDQDDHYLISSALSTIDPDLQLFSFTAAKKALNEIALHSPDLIILDLNMPEMDGFDFLQAFKAAGVNKRIPIVVYSTSSNPKHIEKALGLGASKYIIKPHRFSEIVQKMEEILKPAFASVQ